MSGLLDGKTALVTGGGGGIGRATALAFAREGARVAVADYRADGAAETVGQINAGGGQAITLTGDVTDQKAVKAMLDDRLIEESERRPAPDLDDQRRRYYRITPLGRRVAVAETARLAAIVAESRGKRWIKARA